MGFQMLLLLVCLLGVLLWRLSLEKRGVGGDLMRWQQRAETGAGKGCKRRQAETSKLRSGVIVKSFNSLCMRAEKDRISSWSCC